MRRSVGWLLPVILCGFLLAGCKNDAIETGEVLPAVATDPTLPTVIYRTEEAASEEEIILPEIETTHRTAATEATPSLATTTLTSPTEPTDPTISVIPDIPNVPIGQFTTTRATSYSEPDSFTSGSSDGSSGNNSGNTQGTASSPSYAAEQGTTQSTEESVITAGTLTEASEITDPFTPYTLTTRTSRPYGYKSLNQKELYVYDAIIDAVNRKAAYVDLSGMDGITKEDYCDIYSLLYNDENSIYYLDTNMQYSINVNTQNVRSATVFYKYSASEIQTMQAKIDSETANILSRITPGMTQYDIVKMFYDYLALNVVYDEDAPNCSDIYGVFVDKRAICGGYSKAFSYLCDKVGIETLTITGDADNVPHMWNMVKLGGDWYHIDITYAVTDSKLGSYVRYDHFCVTDEVIDRSRIVYGQPYTYPRATSKKCNYYVRNGLIANSYDEAYKMLYDGILDASSRRALVVEIQCGSKTVYDEAVYNFFSPSQKKVLDLMEDALTNSVNKYKCDNISYGQSDSTYVIKLFLEYTD